MKFISYTPGLRADLEPHGAIADQVHLFDEREVRALNAALAAGRPLLVRGEPGIGKSQLARAAAKMLKRTFIQQVVDSQTESRDLLWRLDSLGRLAEAQLAGALRDKSVEDARADFAIEKFVVPGPLWWGFDWPSAERQAAASARARVRTDVPERGAEADPDNGSVVLIDEIDKAEAEVPNGLLEALGSGRIAPPGCGVVNAKEPAPLVVITTNEERTLPDAFLRRCLVLALTLPDDRARLMDLLVQRGKAHFPNCDGETLSLAAEMVFEDRTAHGDLRPRPGQAEYLDLLRVVAHQHEGEPTAQRDALKTVREFVLKKHVA